MGQVLKAYFPTVKEGKNWDENELQVAMKTAWKDAKAIDWKKELTNSFKFTKETRVAADNQGSLVAKLSAEGRAPVGTRLIVVHDGSEPALTNQLIERTKDNLPSLELVGYSEAMDRARFRMKFPPHHPQANRLYISHPHRSICYLPEDFHRSLFDERVSELLRILRGLGSTRIKINVKKGHRIGTNIGGRARIGILVAPRAEGRIKTTRELSGELKWEEEHIVAGPPHLPRGLVWYHHESDWKRVAEGRLSGTDEALDFDR